MRIIIVSGPRRGKSSLARQFREQQGMPTFCGDPRSKVKDPEDGVTYLPEGLPYAGDDGGAAHVSQLWFVRTGPWVMEGHVMARALRRWLPQLRGGHGGRGIIPPLPCDRIIVLAGPPRCESTKGQETMHKGVMTVWEEIAHNFKAITEYR